MNFFKKVFTKQDKIKEEEKKSESSYIEKRRKEIISSTKNVIDIINSSRLGTKDYDFNSIKKINKGDLSIVFSIKSKIDGKTYVLKRLKYQIGSCFNDNDAITAAEREISCLKNLDHP